MTEGYEQRKEVAFNVGLFQAYFVAGLLNKASDCYNAGDIQKCYHYLQSTRDRMHGDLKDHEIAKLEVKERNISRARNKYLKAKSRQDYVEYKELYVRMVRAFFQYVMQLMKVCGYLPNKRDRARLGF